MNCMKDEECASVRAFKCRCPNSVVEGAENEAIMNEDKRAEWFSTVLSLLYEFNWPMTETEMMQRLDAEV